jgi:transposase
MKHTLRSVVGGVDTHADSHQAAVLDERGRLLSVAEFATSLGGYQQLLDWLRGHGPVQAIGVEGSGSYGAGLTRHLQAAGLTVVEVNRPHAHMRARRGKNDAIDAEAAARKVLAGECTPCRRTPPGRWRPSANCTWPGPARCRPAPPPCTSSASWSSPARHRCEPA